MARPFFAVLSFCLLLLTAGCTQRTICPAFQSAFIYDKNELRKKFSYFQEDSTPKVFATASKNRYLVAEPTTYRKKLRSLQTIEMKEIHPQLPDSMKVQEEGLVGEDGVVPGAELDMAARSVIDSIYIVDVPQDTTTAVVDSAYMISKDKEVRVLKFVYPGSAVYDPGTGKYVSKPPRYEVVEVRFNVEQDNYMWYLRNSLVLPDVRLAQLSQTAEAAENSGKGKKEKKEISGFFRNLFKKKKKSEADSTDSESTKPKEEFDYVDDNEGAAPTADPAKKTEEDKGLFSRKKKDKVSTDPDSGSKTQDKKSKKKKKEKKPKDEANTEEPKKKEDEDEDDGF